MLGIGPIARRAEDLIAVLRIIAGPDGCDTSVRAIPIADPATVSLEGTPVVIAEGTSWRPISRELHDARERAAGALARHRGEGAPHPAAVLARRAAALPHPPAGRLADHHRAADRRCRPRGAWPGSASAARRSAHDGHSTHPAARAPARHPPRPDARPRPGAGRRAAGGDRRRHLAASGSSSPRAAPRNDRRPTLVAHSGRHLQPGRRAL